MLGQHYVKEGTFPIEDAKLYSQLQTMREKGDYNCIYQTTEEEMRPLKIVAKKKPGGKPGEIFVCCKRNKFIC